MYTSFNNRNIQQLKVTRHGWISPEFEFTDDVYSYGKLSIKAVSVKHKATVETADATWHFRFESIWKTSMIITDKNDEVIGSLTGNVLGLKYNLVLKNGFTALFRKNSFWKPKYIWETDMQMPVMRIESTAFSSGHTVYIEQSNTATQNTSLLAFLGVYLIIIRRQRQAAAS